MKRKCIWTLAYKKERTKEISRSKQWRKNDLRENKERVNEANEGWKRKQEVQVKENIKKQAKKKDEKEEDKEAKNK